MSIIDKVLVEGKNRVKNIAKMSGDYFDGERFVPPLLAADIIQCVYFRTLKGNDKMYRYHNGLYKDDAKEFIKELCKTLLKEEFRIRRVSEVIAFIQASTYIDPSKIDNEWINLENGLLNPLTMEFKEHDPEIFSIVRIPIIYDPTAKCPVFLEKIKGKISEDKIKTIQEMFGYCYLTGQRFEKAFLLYGPKRSMKSTTLYVLEKMLGNENVTAYPLHYLVEDNFGVAYLYGVPANICPDLEARALKHTGVFMTITGGDKVGLAQKHRDPISFYPSTKLIFSCNTIPTTYNKNLAFFRRWLPIKFGKQTPIDEVDTKLKEELLKELPGILNWALEGLKRLLKNDGFTLRPTDEEIRDVYEKHSDSIGSFVFNEIDCERDEGCLTKRETFATYEKYCKREELTPENQIKFGRVFKALTGCGTRRVGESSLPAYSGVSLKGEKEHNNIVTVKEFGKKGPK